MNLEVKVRRKSKKEKAVIESWKAYLDLLNDSNIPPEQWITKRVELLVELLHKMAQVLDYDFDKTHIKNSSYSPVAHGDLEFEQQQMRRELIKVLNGEKAIPITLKDALKTLD